MKRLLLVPLLSALIGGGVVVGVLAATGDLKGGTERIVTEVQPQPIAPSNASTGTEPLTPHEIYVRDAPGVVYITSTIVHKTSSPFDFGEEGFGQTEEGSATGSGIVISDEGLILTNWHVVQDATKVMVSFEHDVTVEAKIVGKNPSDDLALLQVPTSGLRLHPLKLGDSSTAKVGDPVLAIGNPFTLTRTLTTGIVSALQREITAPNGFTITNVIQTDAPINPGNSGGPLLNAKGEVIGINSQIETGGSGDGSVGIGFAVPINTAKQELPLLEKGGTIRGPYLGVVTIPLDGCLADLNLPTSGAMVEKVDPGTPAAKAGLKAGTSVVETSCDGPVPIGGDIIVGFDGKRVSNSEQLGNDVLAKNPGEKVKMEILRPSGDGKYTKMTLEATLTHRPNSVPNPNTPAG